MKLESLTNELILNIINSLYPELPLEILEEYQYSDTNIQSLDSVTLSDLIIKSFDKNKSEYQVIYLNTDDLLISILEISWDELQSQHPDENLSWCNLGCITTEDPSVFIHLYIYID